MAQLELNGVVQRYGKTTVVDGVDLRLEAGQIACLLGPSGCGKTTVLRCLAGFEPVQGGRIALSGQVVSAPDRIVPPEARRVGMVFQDYALFPHLCVAANVGFAFGRRPSGEQQGRVQAMLDLVGLGSAAGTFPHELSGGQQQRVALARALAPEPDLLLLDEPFSNLDIDLRERLSIEVRSIIKATGTTAILVTHDQHEAFAIADQIGIMNEGRIEQWDTAYDLYHQPTTRFVADFVGQGVFLRGIVAGPARVVTELGDLDTGAPLLAADGLAVDLLVRPDDIVHDDAAPWRAEVAAKAFRGADFLYTLVLPSGSRVLSLVPSHHNHAIGERIGIRLAIDHVVAFPAA
jgi:iron(III) transport system ATP-binding protein